MKLQAMIQLAAGARSLQENQNPMEQLLIRRLAIPRIPGTSPPTVAVDAAVQNLQHGRCEAGLAVGVNMISDAVGFLGYGPALAPDGKCKTFDAAANGLGRGDACGALVLHVSSEGDHVSGMLLCGSGCNQDGRSASMSAPNGPSQVEVLQAVVQQAQGTYSSSRRGAACILRLLRVGRACLDAGRRSSMDSTLMRASM